MVIKLIVVGSIKEKYYRNLAEEYVKEINKKKKIQVIELKDQPIPQNTNDAINEKIKKTEGEKILENITNSDYVVALCIEGIMNMKKGNDVFKMVMEKAENNMATSLVYIIGGSLGLHSKVTDRADYKLSFSPMTFPHQLMRVMLLEQIAKTVA